jgi:hypothetical protein
MEETGEFIPVGTWWQRKVNGKMLERRESYVA